VHQRLISNVDSFALVHQRLILNVDSLVLVHQRLILNVDSLVLVHQRLILNVDSFAPAHQRLISNVDSLALVHQRLVSNVDLCLLASLPLRAEEVRLSKTEIAVKLRNSLNSFCGVLSHSRSYRLRHALWLGPWGQTFRRYGFFSCSLLRYFPYKDQ